LLAGMLHACLEDWLFAPGYHLCVFYWSLAFIFVDYAPALATADSRNLFFWRAQAIQPSLGEVAPSR